MDKSAIILAGESSGGFSDDKGLVRLNGKPLLNYVIAATKGLVEETIVVTNSQTKLESYQEIAPNVEFVINRGEPKSQLTSALTGFEASHSKYALLLPFDAPFVSREIASLLLELCIGKSAAVPRYSSSEIEPLQAAYNTAQVLEAIQQALTNKEADMAKVVEKMRGVRYISMMVFEQLDPDMQSFFRVHTPLDLKKAATMLQPKKR